MKPNYTILLIFLLTTSCFRESYVAKMKNNQPHFTSRYKDILFEWNKIIKSHHLNGELKILEIQSGTDTINKISYFYLLGKSSNDSLKMAQLLIYSKNKFYLKKDTVISCICFGCGNSTPKMSFDEWGWYCENNDISGCQKIIDLTY